MDFDADGSETGSAVSDEELDLDHNDAMEEHDVCPSLAQQLFQLTWLDRNHP